MRSGVCDLLWLLQRGYAAKSALELVGNRYQLTSRERLAISRAAVPVRHRRAPIPPTKLQGNHAIVDGFNLLITLEVALGGGILLYCQDDLLRDIANIHGTYHPRVETEGAITLLCEAVREAGLSEATILFDRPVSNSGRIVREVNEIARRTHSPVTARTADGVDRRLVRAGEVVLTADSMILERGVHWSDLCGWIIRTKIPAATIVDLRCTAY